MTTDFHPSQYDSLSNAYRAAQLQSWVCAVTAMLLIGVTASTPNKAIKILASAGTLAACTVAQPSRRTCRKLRGLVRDGEDISAAAYQQYLWEALKPQQTIQAELIEPEPDQEQDTAIALPIDDLTAYPSVLLWGAQGSGKTSTAAYILHKRAEAGHQIKVLDPHAEYGQWSGLEVIGGGMDYDAVDAEIETFIEEVKARYKVRSQSLTQFPPITLFCDEFTNWAARCKNSGELFKLSVSDIRKVNAHVLYVSHARTLPGLGDAKGMAATRDSALLEVFLETAVDSRTGKAVPAMRGTIKYPGAEAHPIRLEPWMKGDMNFNRYALPGQGQDGQVRSLADTPVNEALNQPQPISNQDRLEALFNQDVVSDDMPDEEILEKLDEAEGLHGMPEECQHILVFSRGRDWFTLRNLIRGKWQLRNKSASDVKRFLDALVYYQWLEHRQDDKHAEYRLIEGLEQFVDEFSKDG